MATFRLFSGNNLQGRRLPGASLAMAGAALLIFVVPGAFDLLAFQRPDLGRGEIWRGLTCHFTHFSWNHLLWDLIPFLALGVACEIKSRPRFLACIFLASLLITAMVWFAMPRMEIYCGLSGLDSALFCMLTLTLLKEGVQGRDRLLVSLASVCLILFLGKIGYEVWTSNALFVGSEKNGAVPVPLAHLTGAAAGMVSGLVNLPKRIPALVS